jgi:L-alanine-DL-glutamate epimerase-like enolase superfamily enzyme
MTLGTDFEWVDLELDTPFGISRGTTTVSANLVVRIEDLAGNRGVGGAAPVDY